MAVTAALPSAASPSWPAAPAMARCIHMKSGIFTRRAARSASLELTAREVPVEQDEVIPAGMRRVERHRPLR